MTKSILFVSQGYHKALINSYARNSKVSLSYADNNLCRAIIRGFEDNQIDVNIINYPKLGSFPLFSKSLIVKGFKSKINKYDSISYLNIMYFKRSQIKRKIYSKIEQWCRQTPGEKIIFFYSLTFISLIKKLKNKYNDLKICFLVADLPEFLATDTGIITQLNHFMGGDKPASGKSYMLIDGYILLASAMKDKLPIYDKPWIVIEGIYNPEMDEETVCKEEYKTILYTGDLGRRYGIVDLLKAFHGIKYDDYRLWICGGGDGLEDVLKYTRIDKRIKYWGCLPRREIIAMQKKSTLLINPRKSSEEYTKYSFPSKTMEYLASGTPTLMAPLQCIPKDYNEHLYYIEDETIIGLRNSIIDICSRPIAELQLKGRRASNFILENKMPKIQVGKIIKFLYSL